MIPTCAFWAFIQIGVVEDVRAAWAEAKALKESCLERAKSGECLNGAVSSSLWITADQNIAPTPWEPEMQEPLRLNLNAALKWIFMLWMDCLLSDARSRQKTVKPSMDFVVLKGLKS